tara:strand:- start:248 stop:433 length:186 start_codon:yes stop_codon:yes gene_type:complete
MFDHDSKIEALVNNYGLKLLMEQNDLDEEAIIRKLVDDGTINTDDYFYLDIEIKQWEELED